MYTTMSPCGCSETGSMYGDREIYTISFCCEHAQKFNKEVKEFLHKIREMKSEEEGEIHELANFR
jgi:hypothetical protein